MHWVHFEDACIFLVYTLIVFSVDTTKFMDFSTINLNWHEMAVIYFFGCFSVILNVLPKYYLFHGAARHHSNKKKCTSANYIRLGIHIISGAGQFFIAGWYCLYPESFSEWSVFKFKSLIIFMDFVHEITIVLLLRNHDGIFTLRVYNLGLAVYKCIMCAQLFKVTTMAEVTPFVQGIYLCTAGFSSTRVFSALILVLQLIFVNSDFDYLRENWYSWGLLYAVLHIAVRLNMLGWFNFLFLFCVIRFPHELWRYEKYYDNSLKLGLVYVALAFVRADDMLFQLSATVPMTYYVFMLCGNYLKRTPLANVDFRPRDSPSSINNLDRISKAADYARLPYAVGNIINDSSFVTSLKSVSKITKDTVNDIPQIGKELSARFLLSFNSKAEVDKVGKAQKLKVPLKLQKKKLAEKKKNNDLLADVFGEDSNQAFMDLGEMGE